MSEYREAYREAYVKWGSGAIALGIGWRVRMPKLFKRDPDVYLAPPMNDLDGLSWMEAFITDAKRVTGVDVEGLGGDFSDLLIKYFESAIELGQEFEIEMSRGTKRH